MLRDSVTLHISNITLFWGPSWSLVLFMILGGEMATCPSSDTTVYMGLFRYNNVYGHGGYLYDMIRIILRNVCSPMPLELYMNSGLDWPSGFWDVRRVWTTEPAYTYEPKDFRMQKIQRVWFTNDKNLTCLIYWWNLMSTADIFKTNSNNFENQLLAAMATTIHYRLCCKSVCFLINFMAAIWGQCN